jgi:hypothetical protein
VNGSKQDWAETWRDDLSSESIAVGSEGFVEQVKNELRFRAHHLQASVTDGFYILREPVPTYDDDFDRGSEA